jgi:hypothetical protein
MATVSPYHTNSPEYPPAHRNVHHNKDTCPDGRRILTQHKLSGTGNKPLCKECPKVS